ncbi:MAG: dNTP triphosphohydrolase [Acidobacteriaceae bacterium]|nr:dNTP triphosphohydrolase [Acidobacteriaceae bacterium]MBV8569380.1 dNTP triphosphohydrolase [Acidobacteriaceae bacterium]
MLGRLRLGPSHLQGRRFPESPHPYRNDLQRDRDRIIHSRAFRRLEGKTQVFAAGRYDHFRNRLTHTIEVAQIARTVAATLELNEEYTETLALAHDLGHPPLGHVGEKALNRQMQRFGASFEHNLHALRIVDELEERYARFHGLNLTFEVREGIVKHSREVPAEAPPSLREFLPGKRPLLEAQIIDLADEISYSTADLDDAVNAGLITMPQIAEAVPFAAALVDQVDTQFPGSAERIRFWEVQRQLINVLTGGLIEGTAQAAKSSGVEMPEDVREVNDRIARMTPQSEEIKAQLKLLLSEGFYSFAKLVEERTFAVAKMNAVFEYLLDHPERVSAGYREALETMPAYRVVCDYVAGMTDGYLDRVHRELLGS